MLEDSTLNLKSCYKVTIIKRATTLTRMNCEIYKIDELEQNAQMSTLRLIVH